MGFVVGICPNAALYLGIYRPSQIGSLSAYLGSVALKKSNLITSQWRAPGRFEELPLKGEQTPVFLFYAKYS